MGETLFMPLSECKVFSSVALKNSKSGAEITTKRRQLLLLFCYQAFGVKECEVCANLCNAMTRITTKLDYYEAASLAPPCSLFTSRNVLGRRSGSGIVKGTLQH